MAKSAQDRIFVRDGRRHYRRRYSRTEMVIGSAILVLLAGIVSWVAWKGGHPDPELFRTGEDLLQGAPPPAARGPVPEGLAPEGWTEGRLSRFDYDNLYVKINGREDYYKSFGFQYLYFVSLEGQGGSPFIDIEFFDLGETENALGAYAGERNSEIVPDRDEGGLSHRDRNAVYLARGPYYIRVIGSDESEKTGAALEQLRDLFRSQVGGSALPLPYAVFVKELGLEEGEVAYTAENAFSLGFAKNVYSALLADGETEIFLIEAGTPQEAGDLSGRFAEGFLEYGEQHPDSNGQIWVQDRYIKTIAGTSTEGGWVIGVRGAPDLEAARQALDSLSQAVAARAAAEGKP